MLEQEYGEEALDRAEERTVDHHRGACGSRRRPGIPARSAAAVAGSRPGWSTSARSGRVASRDLDADLGAVERGAARVGDELEAGGVGDLLASAAVATRPSRRRTPRTCRRVVAGRELEVEVGRARSRLSRFENEGASSEVSSPRHLLAGAVDVRVVLGEAARPGRGRGRRPTSHSGRPSRTRTAAAGSSR